MAKRIAKPKIRTDARRQVGAEALFEGDVIEFKLTYEVEVDQGIRAWVGYGNISQVQPGESGSDADKRVRRHVKNEIRKRVQEAIDEA